ncbi:hypothetical protein F6X40_17370 [Paraburkholderia sp. UCT31]|uniref:conjugal transfer protein TraN n=1 Tax=Paraburkholderia sp. UCT31 TaxID=2615209 RepID=UPI001655A7AA|nr:conjugal transfer protein TraN [Paraburkholderia sp. UCT31]MBC8738532.1 hypothetical protein [Paraburkholderia sp. UCT31]
MKKTALLLCLLTASSVVGVSPAAFGDTMSAGIAIAQGMTGKTAAFDANGNIATSASGAATATSGHTAVQAQGTFFNSMMGVTSVQGNQTPGAQAAAQATVSGTSYGDFACTGTGSVPKSVGGLSVRLTACNGGSGGVTSVALQVCSATLQGAVCDANQYTNYTVRMGDWVSLDPKTSIGVSCNGSNVCRVSVSATKTVGGNDAAIRQQTAAAVAAQGASGAAADFQKIAQSKSSAQQAVAENSSACFLMNQDRLSQGLPAVSCDGQSQVSGTDQIAQNATNAASCDGTYSCARTVTSAVNYTQVCTRTFPLSEYDCTYQIPSKDCTVTAGPRYAQDNSDTTSSCSAADLEGAHKVGSTQGQTACDNTGKCVPVTQWTDYYVFPDQATQSGSCTAYPYQLNGTPAAACSNQGKGQLTGCASGGWYGRTLPDSQCTNVSEIPQTDGSVAQTITNLTNADKNGCGYCVMQTMADTCYAQPGSGAALADDCSTSLHNNCQLQSVTPQSSVGGLTTSQQEQYQCTQSQTQCAEWQQNTTCTGGLTHGLDGNNATINTNPSSFTQGAASAAVIDAIAKSGNTSAQPGALPLIFSGADLRCRKPVGFLSGTLMNDCCRTDLKQTGGGSPFGQCSQNEVTLAAARRADTIYYVGEYCSKKIGFGPFKKCIENTQTYCTFDGLLPKTVQIQGRQQLAQLTTTGFGSVQSQELKFNYYDGNGGWGQAMTVNGVTVVPWRNPTYCQNPDQAASAMQNNPNAVSCPPVLTQWFAVCDSGQCGNLPDDPALGAAGWVVQQVDPLKNEVNALSRYASISGACDPASSACSYKVNAWPAGIGGKAVMSRQVSFPLFATPGVAQNEFSIGDYVLRPVAAIGAAGTASMPDNLDLEFSIDYGQSWSTLALPTHTPDVGVTLPNSDVNLSGSCSAQTNLCQFKMVGTVVATAKPWGSAQGPDCSGFTASQLSVLDFDKMDFSEWMAQVMNNVKAPDGSSLAQTAVQDSKDFYNAVQSGASIAANVPGASQTAVINPTQGLGPFIARLTVASNYPTSTGDPATDTDPVSSVKIDWGDGSLTDVADLEQHLDASGKQETAYAAQHQYPATNKLLKNPATQNVPMTVTLTISSKSGIHYTTLQVTDVWDTIDGVGLNGQGTSSVGKTVTTAAPKAMQ